MVVTEYRITPFLILPLAIAFAGGGLAILGLVCHDVLVDRETIELFRSGAANESVRASEDLEGFQDTVLANSFVGGVFLILGVSLYFLRAYWLRPGIFDPS